jgi:hypothetical protein
MLVTAFALLATTGIASAASFGPFKDRHLGRSKIAAEPNLQSAPRDFLRDLVESAVTVGRDLAALATRLRLLRLAAFDV